MTNHAVRLGLAGLIMTGMALTGCTTVARQAFHELRGAKADVLINLSEDPDAVAHCQGVRFQPVASTLSERLCPARVLRAYDAVARAEADRLLTEYPGGDPELTVESDVQFLQGKGLLSGALMLTRVKMRQDADVLVDALVVAESKAFREGSREDLTEATVEALGKWLRQRKGAE